MGINTHTEIVRRKNSDLEDENKNPKTFDSICFALSESARIRCDFRHFYFVKKP